MNIIKEKTFAIGDCQYEAKIITTNNLLKVVIMPLGKTIEKFSLEINHDDVLNAKLQGSLIMDYFTVDWAEDEFRRKIHEGILAK